jgi:hypothetical protein
MKISNFIGTIDPKREREFNQWVKVSTLFLGLCVCVIVCIEGFQLWNLFVCRLTRRQYSRVAQQYNRICEQKNTLLTKEQELKTKINTVTGCADTCSNRIEQLKGLGKISGDVRVVSYMASDKTTTVTINCPTIKHAQHFIATFAVQHKLDALTVASVEPGVNGSLMVTLKTNS